MFIIGLALGRRGGLAGQVRQNGDRPRVRYVSSREGEFIMSRMVVLLVVLRSPYTTHSPLSRYSPPPSPAGQV